MGDCAFGINKKTKSNKHVYKVKYNVDGTIERRQARLVSNLKGIINKTVDYRETFSQVVKMVIKCMAL